MLYVLQGRKFAICFLACLLLIILYRNGVSPWIFNDPVKAQKSYKDDQPGKLYLGELEISPSNLFGEKLQLEVLICFADDDPQKRKFLLENATLMLQVIKKRLNLVTSKSLHSEEPCFLLQDLRDSINKEFSNSKWGNHLIDRVYTPKFLVVDNKPLKSELK